LKIEKKKITFVEQKISDLIFFLKFDESIQVLKLINEEEQKNPKMSDKQEKILLKILDLLKNCFSSFFFKKIIYLSVSLIKKNNNHT